ncbi:MAG: prolipoprotein diacylglyceryl transferase [Acidobacteria bacterium]|nr:prolipoprotein diacylglyceryl transferase [Acidobacteriota bacterium]
MYPKVLDLGTITIHTYGLFLAAAFIVGIWITGRNGRKAGIDSDTVWNMGLLVLFSALVGSKVFLLLADFSYYRGNFSRIFSLSTFNLNESWYGGLFMALGAAACFVWKKKLPPLRIADLAAPGIALGQAIAGIGCFFAGCCYGNPTNMPWGIAFSNPYTSQNQGTPLHIPLHPTQLYEAAGAFILFLFLMHRLSRKSPSGQIILQYLGLYAVLRFALEFFRGDERGFVLYGLLSTSQMIALFILIGSAVIYCLMRYRPMKAQKH